MKKTWKYLIATVVLATAAVTVTGCSQWDPVYKHMDAEGYTVSVRFDANGGVFAGKEGATLVDVFKVSDYAENTDGMAEIRVLDPEDPARKKVGNYAASRTGYFLAGWYTTRELRVNEQGEPLDDYGELTSVSGREQGYIYSDRWDFDTRRLLVDPDADSTSSEPAVTLYAAWIPYFNFEFYAPDGEGTMQKLDIQAEGQYKTIRLPVWNESTGKLDMMDVPAREGMTFVGAFLDEDMTTPAETSVSGTVDMERGVAESHTIKLYTTWREGNWFRIYNAKQLFSNSTPGGCYELYADLDFAEQIWSPTLSNGEFKGMIVGNGHTIRNVTVNQGDNSKANGGLFGVLSADAVITDVTFENITYVIAAGARVPDAAYGLLAGTVRDGATLSGVSVSGSLIIGRECAPRTDYSVGLLFGVGSVEGMSHENITCTLEDPESNPATVEVDATTGEVKLTFAE